MEFDPPSRAAGQRPPLPELVQFLKDKNLDGQLEKLLAMSETEVPQMASQFGCGDEEVEQLGELLKQERNRRANEPSLGGRLAEALKNSGAQIEAGGRKVHVPAKLLDDTLQVSGEHRWAMRVYEAEFPKEFVKQQPDKDKIILLLGDRTSKQDLINLMLNYNVGMKLQEPRLEMDMDQGTEVHSTIASFKIPAILSGRMESRLTIINAPDFDNDGMEDLIAGQVKQFLTKHQYTLSGVCCLVQGSKDTSENYKKAFKAVLKEFGHDIAERTMLCIMSGERSDADEKLKDVRQSMQNAGVLYRKWAHFKWPLLSGTATASQAWQDNSDYLTQLFMSLSGQVKQKQKDARVDSNEVARKQLLELLEKNPDAAQADLDAEKKVRDVLEDAPEAAKRIVVIGGTGLGKSTFCGLLDGSLKRDPNIKGKSAWSSNFKLGHKLDSETDVPQLKFCDWRGVDATLPIIIMDTPGMGDSRGGEKDEKHLGTIAGWVNALSKVHLVILLVNPDGTITGPLRTILQEFEERFGRKLWAHTMVAVNRWNFDGDQTPEEFEEQFREVLQVRSASALPCQTSDALPGQVSDAPLGKASNAHVGLGFTKEVCDKMLPFAFLNVQYRSDQTRVAEAMETALDKMKATLKELTGWDVRVKAQSEPLNALIDAVRKSNDSATLKHVFDSAKSRVDKHADLTKEKLDAVKEEILRREDLEAAEESLSEAEEALGNFKKEGTQKHAETFVQKFDTAMRTLPDGMTNPRKVSSLKLSWDVLKAALEGKEDLCKDLPMELQPKVDQLLQELKRMKKIETILSAWKINLSKDQLSPISAWGAGSEAELARYISEEGLSNFPDAAHPRAKILKEWNGLKDSSTEKWTDASATVKGLEVLLSDSKRNEVPLIHVQKMEDKLEKAKADAKKPRVFTTLKLNMAWRPFGHLADARTILSIKEGPEAFSPAEKIFVKFNDKGVYVEGAQRRMENEDGVMYLCFDISCVERIPAGDVHGSLSTSAGETVDFNGKMTIPGNPPTPALPFCDKHYYSIYFYDEYNGDRQCVKGESNSNYSRLFSSTSDEGDATMFRFEDTGKGKREFKIFSRQSGRVLTKSQDRNLLKLRDSATEGQRHVFEIEHAGFSDWYFIRSKYDEQVMYNPKGREKNRILYVKTFTGDDRQKFEFSKRCPV